MPRWARIGLTIGGVASLLAVGAWALLSAIANDMCANEPLWELPSPDGKVRAVVFQRDCGATTGLSTQISVIRVGEALPNRGGNLFVADTDHGRAPAGVGGGPEVRVTWIGDRALRISHHRDARVFRADRAASGVAAEYAAFQ